MQSSVELWLSLLVPVFLCVVFIICFLAKSGKCDQCTEQCGLLCPCIRSICCKPKDDRHSDMQFNLNFSAAVPEVSKASRLLRPKRKARTQTATSSNRIKETKTPSEMAMAKIRRPSDAKKERRKPFAPRLAPQVRPILYADLQEIQQLGTGISGRVFEMRWRGTPVAVKLSKTTRFSEVQAENELNFLDRLNGQPNVVRLLGWVKSPQAIVLELHDCRCIQHLLCESWKFAASSDFSIILRILQQAAAGLLSLHNQRVLHRDVGARNFLCDSKSNVVISDFGLAVQLGQLDVITESMQMAPIPWMAPEAVLEGKHSTASDVYMFGSFMFEVFARHPPWSSVIKAGDLKAIVEHLRHNRRPSMGDSWPPCVCQIISDCWNQSPTERPTMAQVQNRLLGLQTDLQLPVPDIPRAVDGVPSEHDYYASFDGRTGVFVTNQTAAYFSYAHNLSSLGKALASNSNQQHSDAITANVTVVDEVAEEKRRSRTSTSSQKNSSNKDKDGRPKTAGSASSVSEYRSKHSMDLDLLDPRDPRPSFPGSIHSPNGEAQPNRMFDEQEF